MDLLLAMALILITWLIAIAALYGIGCWIEALAPRLIPNFPFARGWIGVCSILAALQWLHFFLPMKRWIAPAFLILGLAGLALAIARKKITLPKTLGNETLFIAIAILWLANRATGQWLPYDTGYYHAATLQWFAQYPVVPGLANLHGPLALNATSLLLAAAIDTGFWPNTSHHINCGLWIVLYLTTFAASFHQARQRPELRPIALFDAALLPLLLAWALGANINGLATDPPAIILSFICVSACFRALLERPNPDECQRFLLFATFIGITAITCKLSALIVVALALSITLVLSIKTQKSKIKNLLLLLTIPLLLTLIPWLARNVIMSGYLVHPLPITAVNVPWRMPAELAVDQAAWIRSWGRMQGATLEQTQGWNWLGPWTIDVLQTHWGDFLTPLGLAIAMLFWIRRSGQGRTWLLLFVPLGALLFWFWNAPDVRFAAFLTAMELGLATALVLHTHPTHKARQTLVAALTLYSLIFVAQQTFDFQRFFPKTPLRVLFVYLPDDEPPLLPMPAPPCEKITLPSGLTVYEPRIDNRVYAATLPAAYKPDPRLQLRQPPDLGRGFIMGQTTQTPTKTP